MVQITEDPVYGTPVFKTMGGQSMCPGETGTSRRESNVKIMEIKHKCGSNSNSRCDETTLNPGDTANFAVIVFNDSPTGKCLIDDIYIFPSAYSINTNWSHTQRRVLTTHSVLREATINLVVVVELKGAPLV